MLNHNDWKRYLTREKICAKINTKGAL